MLIWLFGNLEIVGKQSDFVLNTSSSPAGIHLPGFEQSIQVRFQASLYLFFLRKYPNLRDLIFSAYPIHLLTVSMDIYILFLTTCCFNMTFNVYFFLSAEEGRLNTRFQSSLASLNLRFPVEKAL